MHPRNPQENQEIPKKPQFNFPSCKPKTHKPSNKYQYNKKTRQAIAIQKAKTPVPFPKNIETISLLDLIQASHLLDISISQLNKLLAAQ
jgi:hypothetical protein